MVTACVAVLAFLLVTATAACAIAVPLGSRAVRGLDVSSYQHAGRPMNWRLVARDGIRFVAIKASEGTYYRRFWRDPLWLAAYGTAAPGVPSPWKKWTFWQYNDATTLPGVGLVDVDFYQATPACQRSVTRPAPAIDRYS